MLPDFCSESAINIQCQCPSQTANGGEVDPFVELSLYDPAANSTDVLWSSQMVNEPNPKWGEKFDFTMISATSRLNITVWDKLNFFEGRFSLKGLTGARELTRFWITTLPRADGARANIATGL